VNAKDTNGLTPLHHIAQELYYSSPDYDQEQVDIAELLIIKGANVDARDNKGLSPLHHVAIDNHIGILHLFPTTGADLEAEDSNGWRELHYAAMSRYSYCYSYLLQELITTYHVNINKRTNEGNTALWLIWRNYKRKSYVRHRDTTFLEENGGIDDDVDKEIELARKRDNYFDFFLTCNNLT
jgi:ankyrin repeat protein